MKQLKDKEKIRKIFLDNLPRYRFGKNKPSGDIDWENSIGYKVKGVYNNLEFEVKIVNYDLITHKLTIEYLNEEPFQIFSGHFLNCKLGKLLGRKTNKFKVSINMHIIDSKRDFTITDKEYREILKKDGYIQKNKWYKYKCNKCGWDEGWIEESRLLRGDQCACCRNYTKIVVQGINDIPTTNPEMIKYFQRGYHEAKLYTYGSNKKLYFKCPNCGNIKSKATTINDLHQNGFSCEQCGDGFSIPEKTMYSVLEQLNISFITQLGKKTFKWCENYKYDFYFEYNNEQYIIETHGMQHYKERSKYSKFKKTLQEEQKK